MGIRSSVLDWKIPWTEEICGLQSTGSQRIGQDWAHTHTESWISRTEYMISQHGDLRENDGAIFVTIEEAIQRSYFENFAMFIHSYLFIILLRKIYLKNNPKWKQKKKIISTHSRYTVMIKSMDSGPDCLGQKSYSTTVAGECFLSFFIWKIGIKAPTSQVPLPWVKLSNI